MHRELERMCVFMFAGILRDAEPNRPTYRQAELRPDQAHATQRPGSELERGVSSLARAARGTPPNPAPSARQGRHFILIRTIINPCLLRYNGTVIRFRASIILLSTLILAACGNSAKVAQQLPFSLSSSAFADGEVLQAQYTCDGLGIAPALRISGVPPGTKSLALVLDDLDAPSGHFVHWVVWDIPVDVVEINESTLPGAAVQGTTSAGTTGFEPPCPPAGSGLHHYVFSLYAVNDAIGLSHEATRSALEQRMKGKVLAIAKITSVYERAKEVQ